MMTQRPATSDSPLSRATRERFVSEVDSVVLSMAAAAQGRLSALADQPGSARDQQGRRDALLDFLRLRESWIQAVRQAWRQAPLSPQGILPGGQGVGRGDSLSLIDDNEMENRILASRLTLSIEDKASGEFNDLRLRIVQLDNGRDLAGRDVLKPDTFAAVLVDQWAACGLTRQAWIAVQDSLTPLLVDRMVAAYRHANEFLIRNGVMPVIDRKSLVRRSSGPASALLPGQPSAPAGRAGVVSAVSGSPGSAAVPGRAYPRGASGKDGAPGHRDTRSATADETRMLTSGSPLGRARQRAQGVLGQLRRLLIDRVADFDPTRPGSPSPALAEALGKERGARMGSHGADAAGVRRMSVELRERTIELKRKAASASEKATIEIVALMFQAILAEERIPASVRVWFARLQMPVLRVALDEPEFFGSLQHPARQLIDRMGSCVMGFDASAVDDSAMEAEIRRVVQVIEQYPETGRRVFQLLLDEFLKFLSRFLTEKGATQRLVSVAQQVEQKETLAVQYTIELRKMLNKIRVRVEIREFLFKVWAEVLAVAALRHGPQHPDTLALKRAATDLLWAAGAKPDREDRVRVIQALPKILQRLRQGMTLLGLPLTAQDEFIKGISKILADAFMSKNEVIPQDQIDDMARRLEQLEVAISDDDAGDIVLDPATLEVMLGVDASAFEVLANSGSQPGHAMLAWAQELELGQWFVLDHSGKVAQVQLVWRSDRRQLHLFASAAGTNYLIQARRLASYLQAGMLVPAEEEALTVRATREALAKLDANPERLLD